MKFINRIGDLGKRNRLNHNNNNNDNNLLMSLQKI